MGKLFGVILGVVVAISNAPMTWEVALLGACIGYIVADLSF